MRNLPGKRHVYQHHIQIPEFKNWYKKSTTFSIKIYELLSPRHETILGKTDIKRLLVKMDMFVDLSTKIKNLSGGEFAKLALLKQLYLDHETILLIDEPTNYLDPESVIALAKMLKDSHFTCIIASHNRKFLTEFCQSNYLIKEQKLLTID